MTFELINIILNFQYEILILKIKNFPENAYKIKQEVHSENIIFPS